MSTSHPSDSVLLRYRYQLLQDSMNEKIKAHLASCNTCRERQTTLLSAWEMFDETQEEVVSAAQLTETLEKVTEKPLLRPAAQPMRIFVSDDEILDEVAPSKPRIVVQAHPFSFLQRWSVLARLCAAIFLLLLLASSVGMLLYAQQKKVYEELTVMSPTTIGAGWESGIAAKLEDAAGRGIKKVPLAVEIRSEDGQTQTLHQETNSQGVAWLPVTLSKPGLYQVIVRAIAQKKELGFSFEVAARKSLSLEVLQEKEERLVRALVQIREGAAALPLRDIPIQFALFDPNGFLIAQTTKQSSERGLAEFTTLISPWAQSGTWRLVASSEGVRQESNIEIPAWQETPLLSLKSDIVRTGDGANISVLLNNEHGVPVASGKALLRYEEKTLEVPIKEGVAAFSLPVVSSPILEVEAEDALGSRVRQTLVVPQSVKLDWRIEGGAFHTMFTPRLVLRALGEDNQPVDTELVIFLEKEELSRAQTGVDGYATLEIPAKAVGKKVRVESYSPKASLSLTLPPFVEGPIARCEKVFVKVGSTVTCQVYHPKPSSQLLFLSQHQHLISTTPVPPGSGLRTVQIPIKVAGALSLGFATGLQESFFADNDQSLGISLQAEAPAMVGEEFPFSLKLQDQKQQGRESTVYVSLSEESRLEYYAVPKSEEEARFLLAKNTYEPLFSVYEGSTRPADEREAQDLKRRASLLFYMSIFTLLASVALVLLWFAAKRSIFFLLVFPASLLPFTLRLLVPGAGLMIGIVFCLVTILVGAFLQLRRPLGKITLVSGAVGLLLFSILLRLLSPVLFQENKTVPLALAASSSSQSIKTSQVAEPVLKAPAALYTNAQGALQGTVESLPTSKRLFLLAETFSSEGLYHAGELSIRPEAAVTLGVTLPKVLQVGDEITIPLQLRNDSSLSQKIGLQVVNSSNLAAKLSAKETEIAANAVWQGTLTLQALSVGAAFLTLSAIAPAAQPVIVDAELTVVDEPKAETAVHRGTFSGEKTLQNSSEASVAKVRVFRNDVDMLRAHLDELDVLGCTLPLAALLEERILLFPAKDADISLYSEILGAVSAAERGGKGFSACGESSADLLSTALTLVALRDVGGVVPIDSRLLVQTREFLQGAVTRNAPTALDFFVNWSLAVTSDAAQSKNSDDFMLLQNKNFTQEHSNYRLAAQAAALTEAGYPDKAAPLLRVLRDRIGENQSFSAEETLPFLENKEDATTLTLALTMLALSSQSDWIPSLRALLLQRITSNQLVKALVTRALVHFATPEESISFVFLENGKETNVLLDEKQKSIDFSLLAGKSLLLRSEKRLVYEQEQQVSSKEKQEMLLTAEMIWPENIQQGESCTATLRLVAKNLEEKTPVLVRVSLPPHLVADQSALRSMLIGGEIYRFSIRNNMLWLVLPYQKTSSLSLPLYARSQGTAKNFAPDAGLLGTAFVHPQKSSIVTVVEKTKRVPK